MKGDVEASYVYFIDADNNLKDYCMEETGAYVIDMYVPRLFSSWCIKMLFRLQSNRN